MASHEVKSNASIQTTAAQNASNRVIYFKNFPAVIPLPHRPLEKERGKGQTGERQEGKGKKGGAYKGRGEKLWPLFKIQRLGLEIGFKTDETSNRPQSPQLRIKVYTILKI